VNYQAAEAAKHVAAPMLFGLRVVMLGRQGSGKGTQGAQLARLLIVPHSGRAGPAADRCAGAPTTPTRRSRAG